MTQTTETAMPALLGNDAGCNLIEDLLRQNIRATIEVLFVRTYPRESQEMVFDAHDRAFAFFKGACS
jgi:hypothetical protein